jgi:hypothetical protein
MITTGATSYSGDTLWVKSTNEWNRSRGRDGSLSGRGQVAVSEILLKIRGDELLSARTRGVLSDGVKYDTELLADENSVVGTEVDGKWIKCALGNNTFVASSAEGWNITNTVVVC